MMVIEVVAVPVLFLSPSVPMILSVTLYRALCIYQLLFSGAQVAAAYDEVLLGAGDSTPGVSALLASVKMQRLLHQVLRYTSIQAHVN